MKNYIKANELDKTKTYYKYVDVAVKTEKGEFFIENYQLKNLK